MSIIRETKSALLELFPEQKAAEPEAEKAARQKIIDDARAAAEAAAAAEKEKKEKAAKKAAEAGEKAAEKGAAAPPPQEEKPDAVAETPAEEEPGAAPEDASEELPEVGEDEDPPVSIEPEGSRPDGVLVRDYRSRGYHLDVQCAPEQVTDAAEILDQAGFFLESVAGVDWIKEEQMEVVYDYNRTDGQLCRVAVRTILPRANPEVPTVSHISPGANWHERETHEFFGIKFIGHPQLEPLLLPEDADFHPLLKDFMP